MITRAVLFAFAASALPVQGAGFTDVLAQPAQISPLASRSPLLSVARAGTRLVAVGQRGHIVVSKDNGVTWQQSPVPVSSDLTAVFFVNENLGWAVGHEGVVLATRDGGATWALQFDGKRANTALAADLERKAATQPSSEALKAHLAEAKRYVEQGPDKPFLDVWFADEKNGYVVGAYNLIFKTEDGGDSWTPWFDRTDNPKYLNLYAIRPAAGGLFVAGEAGLVMKLDNSTQRFRALNTGYNGSFFGIVGDATSVAAFGLRGNVYRSGDGGETWAKVDAGLPATIVGGVTLPGSRLVLADAGGRLAVSADGGRTWQALPTSNPAVVASVGDAGEGRLALAGMRGVSVVTPAPR